LSLVKKPRKKNPIPAAIKRADRWFNKFICLRDKRCIISGETSNLQCSHFYGKKACPNVRYDEINAHAMSQSTHYKHHKFDDGMYFDWIRDNYTEQELDELKLRAHLVVKHDLDYYKAIEAKYKELVENMLDNE
jgi:hypothetical protein